MQRIAGLLALALTAALLAGCVYDPYTGTYAPCCGYYGNPYYGNPYYRYPPPYAPYGYPSGTYTAPPQSQPGAYGSPPAQSPPAPYAPPQQSQPGAYPAPPGQSPAEPDAAASPAGGVPAGRLAAASVPHDGPQIRDKAMAGFGSL